MRRSTFAFAALLLAASPMLFALLPADKTDEAAIRETVQQYLHGLKFNDVESLKKAFYPEAKLFFVKKNGELGQLTQAAMVRGVQR